MDDPLKQCSRCDEWKPLKEFHKDSRSEDEHRAACKGCRRIYYTSEHARALQRERNRIYSDNRTPQQIKELRAKKKEYSSSPEFRERRKWREKHPLSRMKARFYHREYRKRDYAKKKKADGTRRYRQTEMGKLSMRASAARQKHKRRTLQSQSGTMLSVQDWQTILNVFGHRCAYCDARNVKLERDHVVPVTRGGSFGIDNVVPACRTCNAGKRTSDLREWLNDEERYEFVLATIGDVEYEAATN